MKVMRAIGWGLGALVALGAVGFFAPRFVTDGPVGPILGGPLRSGDWFELPVSDWTFATDIAEVELQLEAQNVSRTTWILVKDGAAYIPCSLGTPPGKGWYKLAERDGRAIVRIDGKRYPVTLTQDADAGLLEFARGEVPRKYTVTPSAEGGVLFFKLESRAANRG